MLKQNETLTVNTYMYRLTQHLLYVFTYTVILWAATSFGHSLTIIQALTYRTFELVGIIR